MMLFFCHWNSKIITDIILWRICDDMVFVIECASYFTYRDETSIFVIDVHLFYDEMAVVIEVYSFYDDLFSSLI